MEQLVTKLERLLKQVPIDTAERHLFLSVSNGSERAMVKNIRAANLNGCIDWLKSELTTAHDKNKYIRVDIVKSIEECTYLEVMRKLSVVARNNFFRRGIAFDKKFNIAFLPEEIMGNALIKPSVNHKVGFNSPELSFDQKNIDGYMTRKYKQSLKNKIAQRKFYVFDTQGFYLEEGSWLTLSVQKDQEGMRGVDYKVLPPYIDVAITQGADFLQRQIQDSGQFIYGYYPTYDYQLTGYNSVRHFSSLYALLEAQEYLKQEKELEESEKGLDWGLENLTLQVEEALYIKEEAPSGTSLKLGAQALAVLALAKFQTITGNDKYEAAINQLILGMERHFVDEKGETTHILDKDLEIKKKFNIIYYDGEAVFSILRGYAITKNEQHLALAKKLFDRFVAKNYERYHDHWLSYATNEILLYLKEQKYYEFGLKNAFENMDFIEHRDTAYPTLMELLMAAIKMTDQLKESDFYKTGQIKNFVSKTDFWRLHQVAIKRAAIEIEKGVMHPEMAMFMKRPDKIVHGFYTRHDKFRMRIDDQEHFLSGLINFYTYFYSE
ncbi:hypothetical protein JZO70_20855 [Enterococcus sp. 669A]|uniref:Uncharacterized protein n=1 Tax=Candidatus Enterococcus moelleringii TaxID=2815325 RepID=A0ABS3LG66_9ENTE|nr:hypothetical protein [Enterococcus sp. 669A]MBO1308637.1 hypothetical protein [Enterococcus sp. 669A]